MIVQLYVQDGFCNSWKMVAVSCWLLLIQSVSKRRVIHSHSCVCVGRRQMIQFGLIFRQQELKRTIKGFPRNLQGLGVKMLGAVVTYQDYRAYSQGLKGTSHVM